MRLTKNTLVLLVLACLFLSSCLHTQNINLNGWWRCADDSFTINDSPPIVFEERWYFISQGDKVCGIWKYFMGNNLLSSKLYQGSLTDGKALLYKKKVFFSAGTTAFDYIEPIIARIDQDNKLAVRLEAPFEGLFPSIDKTHPSAQKLKAECTKEKRYTRVSSKSDLSVINNDSAQNRLNIPIIDEEAECSKALQELITN